MKGSKPSAHPPRLCLHPPLSMSLLFSLVSLCPLTRVHTHTHKYARRAGRSAGSDARPLSLSQHTHGRMSLGAHRHVHAAMITCASSAVLPPALSLPYLPQVHRSAPEQPARDDLHRPDASSVRREGRERGAENEGGCRRWEPAGIREREGGVRTADDAYVSVRVCAYVLSYSLPSPVSPTLRPPSLLSLPPPPPPLLPLQHPSPGLL